MRNSALPINGKPLGELKHSEDPEIVVKICRKTDLSVTGVTINVIHHKLIRQRKIKKSLFQLKIYEFTHSILHLLLIIIITNLQ